MNRILMAYIPVLHRGYRELFARYPGSELWIIGSNLITAHALLRKDIRALQPHEVREAVAGWGMFREIRVVEQDAFERIRKEKLTVIMPDDEFCRELAAGYLEGCFVDWQSVWLRWDTKASVEQKSVRADAIMTTAERDRGFMAHAEVQAEKSSDFWRQVGGVIVRDGEPLLVAHNSHKPNEYAPYYNGDPRGNFKKGIHIELSTALHAEAALVARAAKEGISLRGTDLYVTTFPCPPCALLVAYSGIRKLYFAGGYSMLDGQDVLASEGVEIIRVEDPPAVTAPSEQPESQK